MATFKYVALAPDGTKVRAVGDAASANVLRNELMLRDLQVVRIREKKSINEIEITKQRVPRDAIMHFSRQMAAFVRSGIPITDALAVVAEGVDNKRFRAILSDVSESLHAGVPFSQALAMHEAIFPPYYIGILRSAEETGRLDSVLEQLSSYMERDLEARNKLRAALMYPSVIAVAAIGVVVLMATYVLPKLTDFFADWGAKMPLSTRILMGISDFFANYWYVTPLVFLGIVGLIMAGKYTDRGRHIRDTMLLKLPLIRDVVRFAAVERFSRILASMLSAGVPMPEAMAAATRSTNNSVFEAQLKAVGEAMLQGEGMAGPIAVSDAFPRAAMHMIRVGEETGTLDDQLSNIGAYYGSELEYKLKRLTTLFEPAVIVFMGAIVGFVAVAMVQSIYGVMSSPEFQ
ncbi:MAG: type II secretion system F family protein [Acidimicrobiia bacterium]|nr:type II secretion system F family protein [Acidimicrobiia bacterium]MCL4293160.1 type II secretion system F family protein [Acidimicrobiia bacterium]